jgi:hypothetical protein
MSRKGDTVLDPFNGTGTTLMAAESLGRIYTGIELDPAYCDITAQRFEQATKIKPILESTGKPHTFLD